MGQQLAPESALDPSAVVSCYVGALGLESPERRLLACQTILCLGRLGLRPGELMHLHAGWIDWENGEIQVPAADPCACELCWESARVAQRAGDGRALADIVAESRWSGTSRAVPFGWSRRLTGVLATALDARDYVDASAEDLRGLVVESAERATGLDPAGVDPRALRASAAAFFADAGFDAPRVADVMGTDVETAAAFTAQKPGRARTHLYQTFDADPPPGGEYPLVSDPDPFEAEPFDPTGFDAGWRADRATAVQDGPAGSPRPAASPGGIDPGAADAGAPVAGTGEAAEPTAHAEGATPPESGDDVDAGGAVVDLETLVTGPVAYELTTRFACSALHNGRPAGGRLLVGQAEFLLAAHGGGEIEATEIVAFPGVGDVAFEWVPESLAEVFDSTVGVAFQRDGERETAVIELPEGERSDFAAALFAGLLGDVRSVVTHPARVGGRITDAEPERRVVSVTEEGLAVETDATISLADVIDVERAKQTVDGDVYWGLAVEHLRPGGKLIRTILAPLDDRDRTLLERHVVSDHRLRERRAESADLSPAQQEVLDALRTNPGTRDLGTLLGLTRDELESLVDSLASNGFVHATEDGIRLTGMGRMRGGDEVRDLDA